MNREKFLQIQGAFLPECGPELKEQIRKMKATGRLCPSILAGVGWFPSSLEGVRCDKRSWLLLVLCETSPLGDAMSTRSGNG